MNHSLNVSQKDVSVSLSGNLDYRGSVLAEKFFSKVNIRDSRQLIVDLKEVNYVSSKGLMLFRRLSQAQHENGRFIQIRGASHFLRESFELAGIDELFVWLEGS